MPVGEPPGIRRAERTQRIGEEDEGRLADAQSIGRGDEPEPDGVVDRDERPHPEECHAVCREQPSLAGQPQSEREDIPRPGQPRMEVPRRRQEDPDRDRADRGEETDSEDGTPP